MPIAFSYSDALAKLASPLARAARPDFLTGRFIADAEQEAAAKLGSIEAKERVLAYCGESAEFAELKPDGVRALDALRSRGSLGALLDTIPAENEAARANLTRFAAELHKLGLLSKRKSASTTTAKTKGTS